MRDRRGSSAATHQAASAQTLKSRRWASTLSSSRSSACAPRYSSSSVLGRGSGAWLPRRRRIQSCRSPATNRAYSGVTFSVMRERAPVYTNRLQCCECGRVSREGERGWTARLTVDDEVVLCCPECDERDSARLTSRYSRCPSLVSLVATRSLRARSAPTTKIAVAR